MEKLLRKRRKAEADGNKTLLTSVCIDLAQLFISNAEYHAAINEYELVAKIYKEENKMLDYACAHRMIAEAYTHLHLYSSALKHEEIYLNVAQKQNNKLEEQRAYATLGHIYLTMSLCSEETDFEHLEMAASNFIKSSNVCEKLSGVISKREQMDMMARLFANLGVIKEAQGKFSKGVELVTKSVNICKKYDIFEQLERSYATLSSIYLKSNDFSSAISNLNLAMETAGRLPHKVSLICTSLLAKADILMKINDLQGAKHVLHKAYKLKTSDQSDCTTIERNLKMVIAMSQAEESLLLTSSTDYKTQKALYERLGDGACYFKNYSSAIGYYKNMLESALKSNELGKVLSPCYISLAQTYLDDKQYDKAIEFYKLDLELSKDSLVESINTIFNITAAMEKAKKDVNEVCAIFNQAQERCKQVEDKKQLARVLERQILYLKKQSCFIEVAKLEPEFEALNCSPSDSESEIGDSADTFAFEDEIDINNITDLSSNDEDTNITMRASRKRNKTKSFCIKRNAKGETQLHVATIAGNKQLVEKLLGQGHVINIRDHAGWLPIHEACICGHLDIVKLLVDKGAAINDRGGAKCEGVTPLHDAASNGHLTIIEYLLSIGASPFTKTDNGQTPLHFLETWKSSATLDLEEETLYNHIVHIMSSAMSKAGQQDVTNDQSRMNEALVFVEDDNDPSFNSSKSKLKLINQATSCSSKLQLNSTSLSMSTTNSNLQAKRNVDDNAVLSQLTGAASDYRNTIDLLRKNSFPEQRKKKSIPVSAHLTMDDVDIDDWLEDDMNMSNKKRRRVSSSFSSERELHSYFNEENEPSSNTIELIDLSDSVKSVFKKRKSQATLLRSGFSRTHDSPSPVESLSSNDSSSAFEKSRACRTQTKISDFVSNSVANISCREERTKSCQLNTTQALIKNQMLYIDVRIDDKLFRIPFPAKDLETLTISWLAKETTKRFYKKEAMKPVIEVETKNGAILCEDDLLSVLFPIGVTQCEELRAKVVKWNVPPLKERYLDACQYLNTEPLEDISNMMDAVTVNLDLSNKKLREKSIPIARALNRQTNLYELNLSGLLVGNQIVEALCESLPTLNNLTILNLSTNHISANGLSCLASTLKYTPLQTLTSLDLSYNPLGNECLKHLADITRNLRLEALNLSAVDFSCGIFKNNYNQNVAFELKHLKNFNVSYNQLGKSDLTKFLSCLHAGTLQVLDIGNNSVEASGLGIELLNMTEQSTEANITLKQACLSWCMLDNADIVALRRILQNKDKVVLHLELLDLSFNEFDGLQLRDLLQDAPPKSLLIMGCDHLKGTQTIFDHRWVFKSNPYCEYLETTLDYVQDFQQCDTLINMFREVFDNRLDIQGLDEGMLKLSVLNY